MEDVGYLIEFDQDFIGIISYSMMSSNPKNCRHVDVGGAKHIYTPGGIAGVIL